MNITESAPAQLEKLCSCKGCRSCLLCEDGKKKNSETDPELQLFFYSQQARMCLRVANVSNTLSNVGFKLPGITIINEFISRTEEKELVNCINLSPWKDSQSGRRKQDYGPKVNFKKRKVKISSFNGLPCFIKEIAQRMKTLEPLQDFEIVEQCNLEYVPERGSQIEPHFDDDWLWGERLVTLNLLSDTWFSMTTSNSEHCNVEQLPDNKTIEKRIIHCIRDYPALELFDGLSKNDVQVKIPLRQRSLVILSGLARHQWRHAIERKDIVAKRMCCTFRELSNHFKKGGEHEEMGEQLLSVASNFSGSVVL